MNRLSLMVLALTMSSPTLLAGVVENYNFKENHTGYTLYFKQINDNEARLMQLNIDNNDTEIVIPSVVKDSYGYEFKVTLKSATSLTKCYRLKRNVLLIRNPPIQSARPFQCAYHPLTP